MNGFKDINLSTIVVMEDNKVLSKSIAHIFEKLGCTVFEAENQEEAVRYYKENHVVNYILDIHMGEDREAEGLDTLEQLKTLNSDIFVGILTCHENHRRSAKNLKADYFKVKSKNTNIDVLEITHNLLKHIAKIINNKMTNIDRNLENYSIPPEFVSSLDDANVQRFYELMQEETFISQNINKYIGIVDGVEKKIDTDLNSLINYLNDNFSGKKKLLKKIELSNKIFNISSSLKYIKK